MRKEGEIEALDHYITAVELGPNSAYARVALALSLTRLGNRDAAIQRVAGILPGPAG